MNVHVNDNTTINFTPTTNGLWVYYVDNLRTVQDMSCMLLTVSDKKKLYTKRAISVPFWQEKYKTSSCDHPHAGDTIIDFMGDCPVTKADVQAAENIFGPNLGSLKGKTVRRANDHVLTGIDPMPSEIMEIYHDVTLAIDITFVNKVPFFITVARGIKFGTIEVLTNRQTQTVRDCLKKVVRLYMARGFHVTTILADNEFKPLRQWYPSLNTCAANEHVPEIERYIRTIKDRSCSTYRMLLYRYLPRIVLVHLLKNAVFWLNAFPHEDGATQKYSPRYIMTGQHLSYVKHAVIEFGAYAQTHEEHTNCQLHLVPGPRAVVQC
jgi:hypothetical protein